MKKGSNIVSDEFFIEYVNAVIPDLIKYLESTKDEEWIEDVTCSNDKKKLCIVNHMITHFESGAVDLKIFFSQTLWNEFFLYRVNDGHIPFFYGNTPKERWIRII